MPQVLYQGPRDELRWNGILFRRNQITPVKDEKSAQRLAALDGFVILPEKARKGGWPKGKTRKRHVENG